MKKFLFSAAAIIFALGAVAFTNVTKAPTAGSYWFRLDASGNQIPQGSVPSSTANDPYSCLLTAPNFCSRLYSDYEAVPGSSPVQYRGKAGTESTIHMKNN